MTIRRTTVTSQGRMEPVARDSWSAFRQVRTRVSWTTSSATVPVTRDQTQDEREQRPGVLLAERTHEPFIRRTTLGS